MDNNFGSIGDFLPESEVKCKVHGCSNMVHISSRMAMQNVVDGKGSPSRMCDECYAKLQTLEDKEVPCSSPGCTGKWVWTKYQQLVSMKNGHTTPPRGFCDECHGKMREIKSRKIECRLKGCSNTWTLTAAEQMKLNGRQPQPKLCDECYRLLSTLTDREISCRIRGCTHTFTWNRFQQLEHIKAGKSLDNPPHMMCEECHRTVTKLTPVEVKCRIKGCEKTWTFSTFEQMEQIVKARNEAEAKGEKLPEDFAPKPPDRMCRECYAFFQQAQDMEQPCRNHHCKNTWTYTRGMQLSQHIKGRSNPSAKYCDECEKLLSTLEDRQMPCMQEGCSGTWTYTREEQLRDSTAGRTPQKKHCHECSSFLASNHTIQVTCTQCGASFDVSGGQQLEVKLGTAGTPSLCADCASRKLNEDIAGATAIECISRPKIYIPKTGPWNEDEALVLPPAGITQETMEGFTDAPRKVVCLGDDLGCCDKNLEKAWPELLRDALQERLGETALLNASMPRSTMARSLLRFNRDAAPFQPDAVVFSSLFAEVMDARTDLDEAGLNDLLNKIDNDFKALAAAIRGIGAKPLCLIPNPIYWQDGPEAEARPDTAKQRATLQELIAQQLVSSAKHAEVNIVDARANFVINGEQSSRRWMTNWCMPNDIGSGNMANWLKNEIVTAGLLQ